MGTKRRRGQDDEASTGPAGKKQQYTQQDAALAELYGRLADDVKTTRLQAARDILKIVDSTDDHDKIEKICQRLIRGLCSNRKAARLGYVIVLTEIFAKRYPEPDLAEQWVRATIETIEAQTTVPSKGSNQERRDYQLGRCLAYRSLVQSRVFTSIKEGKGPVCFRILLEHVFTLYKDAPALRQECGSTINSVLAPPVNKTAAALATGLLQSYVEHGLVKTVEGLTAWLLARLHASDVVFPADVWRDNDPLHPKERPTLLQVLRDNSFDVGATAEEGPGRSSSGIAQKTPSSAWPVVFRTLWTRSVEEDTPTYFAKFWTEVVNDGFFSDKASVERKAIGLQVLQMAIESAPPLALPSVFTSNVIRCLINQRSDTGKTNLYTAAQVPLTALVKRARNDHRAVVPVIQALITTSGLINFDRVTRTKTLEDLVACASTADAESILEIILSNIRRPKTSKHLDAETSRRCSADLLLTIARKQSTVRSQVTGEDQTHEEFPWNALLKVLAKSAYLVYKKDKTDALTKKTMEVFQARTTSVLTLTMETKADTRLDHAWQVVDCIDRSSKNGKYSLALGADDTILQILTTSMTRLRDIKAQETKAKGDRKFMLQAFKLLFALSVLQVHNGDPDAVSILEELEDCYESWSESKNSSSSLIQILLGFISRPSAIFRKMAEQVFSAISGQIGEEGIYSLLDILNKPENLNGQRELFDNAEDVDDEAADALENDSDSDEDSSDDSDASDVEVVEADADEDVSDSASSDDDGSDESDASSDTEVSSQDEADDEMQAFEAKLAQTLGTSLHNGNDDDDSGSEDSDMDDDQMMALDGHLTTIFKERSKQADKKKEHKDAKGTVIHFKARVLDLLSIYVKQCSSSPLTLDLVLPLVQLVRTTNTKTISERSFAILKQLFDTCTKHKSYPTKPADDLFTELAGIHDELRRSPSKIHASAASRSGLFLAKLLTAQDRGHYARLADMYAALQKEWYAAAKSKIPASCFTEWTSWSLNSRGEKKP